METTWSFSRVAQASGRSVEHVRQMWLGLQPDAEPLGHGNWAKISPEAGEALAAALKVRLLSPALIAQIQSDPEAVRQALQALASLLDLG
ncbi:MAG: hypothetical protein ACRDS9_07765, partial [Pseudonocardiaceae bacterium]